MFCPTFRLLSEAGIPPYLDGFCYFKEAIDLVSKDPDRINHITKEIYPEIGRRHGVSGSCVERSMRNALAVAWRETYSAKSIFLWEKLHFTKEKRPSNSEFLSAVSDYLDLES